MSVPVASPAAGAGATYVVTGSWRERVEALAFTLTTSAVVASRRAAVLIADPDGNTVFAGSSGQSQAAGLTVVWGACPAGSAGSGTATGFATLQLPWGWIDPLWQVKIAVDAMDVGDQLSKIFLMVERVEHVEEMFEPAFPAGDYIMRGRG